MVMSGLPLPLLGSFPQGRGNKNPSNPWKAPPANQLGWIFQKSVPTLQTGANSLGYHQKARDSVTLTFSNVQPGHVYECWNSRKGQNKKQQSRNIDSKWSFYPLVGGHQPSRINIPKKIRGLLSQTLNVCRYLLLPPKLATSRQLDQHQWESGYILKIKLGYA